MLKKYLYLNIIVIGGDNMEWIETKPLPIECQNCTEPECDVCDYFGLRWKLSREDELILSRKGYVKLIERVQKEIDRIDEELDKIKKRG